MQFPTINNIKSFILEINIFSEQEEDWNYLLDARDGLSAGWISDVTIGSQWEKMAVDSEFVDVSWQNINKDVIVNLYFESSQAFNDDLNLMSRYSPDQLQTLGGIVKSFIVFNRALSQEEINNFMSGELIGNEEGIVGYWNFSEGIGNALTDLSGNENHGTIYGNPQWVIVNP